MGRHILQRLLTMIPVWFLISVMSFSLIHLSPSDPARLLLGGTDVSQVDVDRLNHQLGLDQPLPIQYLIWMKNMLHGDWGYSYFLHAPVLQSLWDHASVTVGIAFLGLLIALIIGVSTGVAAAAKPGSTVDVVMATLST